MKTDNTNYDLTGTFDERRFRVFRYWAHGKLTKEQIGDIFKLSEGWAVNEIEEIYKRLDVHTRHGAVMKAWEQDVFTKLNSKLKMEVVV